MENETATLEERSEETYEFKSKHQASQSKYVEALKKIFLI